MKRMQTQGGGNTNRMLVENEETRTGYGFSSMNLDPRQRGVNSINRATAIVKKCLCS